MNTNRVWLLAALGASVMGTGLLVGLREHSVLLPYTGVPVTCGSPWSPGGIHLLTSTERDCVRELGNLATTATILTVLGAAVVLGVLFLLAAQPASDTKPEASA